MGIMNFVWVMLSLRDLRHQVQEKVIEGPGAHREDGLRHTGVGNTCLEM